MTIWISFLIIVNCTLLLYSRKRLNNNLKYISYKFLIFVVVYFSAFRAALGADYTNYLEVINWKSSVYTIYEPAYTFAVNLTRLSFFTELVFFLFFALITNVLLLDVYRKSRNIFLAINVYILCPLLYFQSFNLVRQMCAAAIILYGIKFLAQGKVFQYFVVVGFASLFHVSAIFMAPISLLLIIKYKNPIYFFAVLISLVIGNQNSIDISSFVFYFAGYYDHYKDYEVEYSIGFFSIFLNLTFFYMLFRWSSLKPDNLNKIYLNMFFILCLIYNITPNFPVAFRFSMYFIVALPLIFASFPGSNLKEYGFNLIILIVMSLMFFALIYNGAGDFTVVPENIHLPLDLIK